MAAIEKRSINERNKPYFLQFASDNTSQNGEDGIISKILELIEINKPGFKFLCFLLYEKFVMSNLVHIII
jgi:hypothetical protein